MARILSTSWLAPGAPTDLAIFVEPNLLLCKCAWLGATVTCVKKRGGHLNYSRASVSTSITTHTLSPALTLHSNTERHVPSTIVWWLLCFLCPSIDGYRNEVHSRQASDLARVIREYEAGWLHDAEVASDPIVPPVLNWSSSVSSRPL
jgi:hypothetical protein